MKLITLVLFLGSSYLSMGSTLNPQVKGASFSASACGEDGVVEPKCATNQVINILSANYGRTRTDVCSTGANGVTNCISSTSLGIVKTQCNGKESCKVPASADVFGDPCPGVTKYLTVIYECNPKVDERVQCCQDDTTALDCPSGQSLEIMYANWGRTDLSECLEDSDNQLVCQRDVSTSVKASCEGKNNCTLTCNTATYGDPLCGDTYYLDIQYRCVNRTVLCDPFITTLKCPTNYNIVITTAMFGRSDLTTCKPLFGSPGVIGCNSTTSYSRTVSACSGRNSCLLAAFTAIYGNPCIGTYKYLDTSWYCTPIL